MGKKKPKNTSSSTKDASAPPVTQQQQRPTRKRGRPRKIVIEEKDPAEGALEGVDLEEQETANKKPRAGTEEQLQQHPQQKGEESSCSAAVGEVTRQEEKPRSRGRRKGRPHKST